MLSIDKLLPLLANCTLVMTKLYFSGTEHRKVEVKVLLLVTLVGDLYLMAELVQALHLYVSIFQLVPCKHLFDDIRC